MKLFVILAVIIFLVLPASVEASQGGWETWPKAPKIVSIDPITNGQSTIRFSKPQYAGKRVKVYVLLRYEVEKSSKHPYGIAWSNREATVVLDGAGNGSIQLKKLKDEKKYYYSLSLKRLEPHIERTKETKMKKLRPLR